MPSSGELRDHGGVSEPSPPAAEWLPVSRAAELAGVPKRTLYAYIERREVAVREMDGVRHVQLEAVRALLAARKNVARANLGFAVQRHDAAAPAAPDVPDLLDARARIERRRLEAEEMRAVDGVREVRDELADAEAARAARRLHEELAAERERLEVKQLLWRQQHERDEAERDADWRAQQRQADQARERASRASSLRRQEEEHQRRRWARDLEDAVAMWAFEQFGPPAVAPAREAVARVVAGRTPGDDGPSLNALLRVGVESALAEFIEARDESLAREARKTLVSRVVSCYRATDDDLLRIRRAAEVAAERVGSVEGTSAASVWDAARAEYEAIGREHAREHAQLIGSLAATCIEVMRLRR